MFKKKGTNNKRIDLQQQTEQIETRQLPNNTPINPEPTQKHEAKDEGFQDENANNGSKTPILKKKAKFNMFSLQGMQKSEVSTSAIANNKLLAFEQQKVASSDIQLCFNEIRKLKETEPIIEQSYPQETNHNYAEQKPNKTTIRMEDVNLESEPEILEIEVDEEGGFSPELNYGRMEDYDDVNGDYEDQLIRKTLTKRNYDNLEKHGGISLNKLKQNEAKDSFVEKLKKVNAVSIKKAIARDLYNKKIKLNEINGTLKQIALHGGNKKHEIQTKQKRLKALKQEFDRVGKVIEFIYYHGDKINEFSIEGIEKSIIQRQNRNNNFNFDEQEEF